MRVIARSWKSRHPVRRGTLRRALPTVANEKWLNLNLVLKNYFGKVLLFMLSRKITYL